MTTNKAAPAPPPVPECLGRPMAERGHQWWHLVLGIFTVDLHLEVPTEPLSPWRVSIFVDRMIDGDAELIRWLRPTRERAIRVAEQYLQQIARDLKLSQPPSVVSALETCHHERSLTVYCYDCARELAHKRHDPQKAKSR